MRRPLVFLLGAGLFLALALPLPGHAFWFDEVFTANLVTFKTSPLKVVERVAKEDAHPPGFYLLAWAYAKATGLWGAAAEGPPPEGLEAKARLLPALTAAFAAGVAGLTGGPLAALAAAGNEDLLLKGREFRMYPLLGLLWALAYLGAVRQNLPLAAWAGLGALWTHYLAPFLLAPLYLFLLLEAKDKRRALLTFWPLLLFLPWLPALLGQLRGGMNMAAIRPDPVLGLEPLYRLAQPDAFGLLLLGVVLHGAWQLRGSREGILVLLPFLGVLLWWGTSLLLNTVSLRYVGAFVPPMAAALGLAASALSRRTQALLLLVLGVAYLSLFLRGEDRPAPPDEGFRRKAAILAALKKEAGPFTVLGDEQGRLISLRYYWRSESQLRLVTPEDLREPPFNGKGVLVLLQYPGWVSDQQVALQELLNRAHARVELRMLDRGTVPLYLWKKKP
jgi:hypothetical protein